MKTACHECGAPVRAGNHRCFGCRQLQFPMMEAAHGYVRNAVVSGELPSLRQTEVSCVDCGSRACDYDHRDHMRFMDVEPVCRRCNNRRGPAAPIVGRMAYLLAVANIYQERA